MTAHRLARWYTATRTDPRTLTPDEQDEHFSELAEALDRLGLVGRWAISVWEPIRSRAVVLLPPLEGQKDPHKRRKQPEWEALAWSLKARQVPLQAQARVVELVHLLFDLEYHQGAHHRGLCDHGLLVDFEEWCGLCWDRLDPLERHRPEPTEPEHEEPAWRTSSPSASTSKATTLRPRLMRSKKD